MSNNRNFQMLFIVVLIMLAFLATISAVNASAPAKAVVPITGVEVARDYSDYYQRHAGRNVSAASIPNTADYFFRHPELRAPASEGDLSDYYFRHPELKFR